MKDHNYIALGLIFGFGIGTFLGLITDSIGVGVSMGTCLGITFAVVFKNQSIK